MNVLYLIEKLKIEGALDGITLNEIEIKGKKYKPIVYLEPTALIGRIILEKGLESSYPLERMLPGTRIVISAANIVEQILVLSKGGPPL